jgi:copper(I)-binding protein
MFKKVLVSILFATSFASLGTAHEYKVGDLLIDHPYTRATPAQATTAGGYMVIRNDGAEPDRLIGGSADFVERIEIHEMSMDNGVMKMRALEDGLELPAGESVALEPGGYHVMFIGMKEGFSEGDTHKATLEFEKAGSVDVDFIVEAMGAKAEPHGEHKMHSHDGHKH